MTGPASRTARTDQLNRTTAPVTNSAPAHNQSMLSQAVLSSLSPSLRYTTCVIRAVVTRYAPV